MAIIKVADLGISSGVATPAFEAFRSSNQTNLSSAETFYKIQCDAEIYDTDSCYDNSTNYRFTPTVAGKYYLYAKVTTNDASVTTKYFDLAFYKNGTRFTSNFIGADGDYYEMYAYADVGSNVPVLLTDSTTTRS